MPITYRAFFVPKAVGTSIHLVGYSINNSVAGLVEYAVWDNAGIGKFDRLSERFFSDSLTGLLGRDSTYACYSLLFIDTQFVISHHKYQLL